MTLETVQVPPFIGAVDADLASELAADVRVLDGPDHTVPRSCSPPQRHDDRPQNDDS